MTQIKLGLVLFLLVVVLAPGIHILENAWMYVEAGAGNWVPPGASMISFDCTDESEGGNASYCLHGHDWTNYYVMCSGCSGGFSVYPKSAAKHCPGFQPHDSKTWCARTRAAR